MNQDSAKDCAEEVILHLQTFVRDIALKTGAQAIEPIIRKHFQAPQPSAESEDTKRLDWLERNPCAIGYGEPANDSAPYTIFVGSSADDFDGQSLREAIDKAIATHQKGE